MKFLKTYFFFFLVCLSHLGVSQNIHDFRSINSGDWNNVNNWEYYDGTSWVTPAPYYPGNGATNDVLITNSNTISIQNAPIVTIGTTNPIGSVTIGDQNAGVETLEIYVDSGLNTNDFTIDYDGLMVWVNNVVFSLPADTSFAIEHPDPHPFGLDLGVTHGVFINSGPGNPCSNAKTLEIGSVRYATCKGAGAPDSFDEINNDGGNQNISLSIIANNTLLCLGNEVNLEVTPSGSGYDASNPTTYSWTITPASASFTNSASNIQTHTPTVFDDYTYEVTVTNSGNTATRSITITFLDAPSQPVSNGNIIECATNPIQTLDANNALVSSSGVTWYNQATLGSTIATPTLNTIGTITYYAETSNGTCSSLRTAVTLTLNNCNKKVITNRRITYRVKK